MAKKLNSFPNHRKLAFPKLQRRIAKALTDLIAAEPGHCNKINHAGLATIPAENHV
jgi:hypothetical protein